MAMTFSLRFFITVVFINNLLFQVQLRELALCHNIFISLLTGALKQHTFLKKGFIRTQKPEKHPKSVGFDDECICLLQKRTKALKVYQRQTSVINWKKKQSIESRVFGTHS